MTEYTSELIPIRFESHREAKREKRLALLILGLFGLGLAVRMAVKSLWQ
jgi:hypothetical protein